MAIEYVMLKYLNDHLNGIQAYMEEPSKPEDEYVIIEKTGSSPRGEGSMMFLTETETIDTIGGGAVEYAAIEDARANKEGVFIKEYCLSNRTAENLGMICGGENKVLFVPL